MNKVKSGLYGFVALAAALAAGFYLLEPGRLGRESDHTIVTLTVAFVPAQRTEAIKISVRLNGKLEYSETTKNSPWQDSIPVPVGTTVTLLATQYASEQSLSCSITTKSQTFGPNLAKPSNVGFTCVVVGNA